MSTNPTLPEITTVMGRSRCVRGSAAPAGPPAPARSDATDPLNAETMVGSVLSRVMKPPQATAPAPIWRT